MDRKYSKTEVSLIIYLATFMLGMFMYMIAFHNERQENKELKQTLEECRNK